MESSNKTADVTKFLMDKTTYSRKNHGLNAHLQPRVYYYKSEYVEQWLEQFAAEQTEQLRKENASLRQQLSEREKDDLLKVINEKHEHLEREDKSRRLAANPEALFVKAGEPSPSQDFERCSPTACGCKVESDCPNRQPVATVQFVPFPSQEQLKEDIDVSKKPDHSNQNRCNLPDDELLQRADKWIRKLCDTGGGAWCLRVPVDFENDPDMLFTELILRHKEREARIKELEAGNADKWVSIKERLPENHKDVLCFIPNNHVFVGNYTKGHEIEYWDDDYDDEYAGTLFLKPGWYECEETPGGEYDEVWVRRPEVTHWQPLPSKPK